MAQSSRTGASQSSAPVDALSRPRSAAPPPACRRRRRRGPEPPSGSVSKPDGSARRPAASRSSRRRRRSPAASRRPCRCASSSACTTRPTAAARTSSARTRGPSSRCRICCWRFARVRSSSAGLQSFLRVRASASACLPSRWFSPLCRSERDAAVALAAVESRADAAGRQVQPPSESTNFGKFVKSTSTRWLIGIPRKCSIGAGSSTPPAERVGRVDLLRSVAGDVDDRVARDREARRVAAADAPQHDRVASGSGRRGSRPAPSSPRAARRSRGSGSCWRRRAGSRPI